MEKCEEGKVPAAPWILPLTLTSDWSGKLQGQTETRVRERCLVVRWDHRAQQRGESLKGQSKIIFMATT